jgi:homoprotocatechuate degradation regulator HpaR
MPGSSAAGFATEVHVRRLRPGQGDGMRRRVTKPGKLPPYRESLAGTLLKAREAVMGPIRPMLRDVGVTEQQWRVMRVLDNAGSLEPTTLSEAALLYPPSVARIVRELVERGLVSRLPHPTDRRRAVLSLSRSGRLLMSKTSMLTLKKLDDYAQRFGPARLAALVTELRAFSEAIREDEPGAQAGSES